MWGTTATIIQGPPRRSSPPRRMSAFGYMRTLWERASKVCFTPESRNSRRKIASVPESGHWMSALPPIADINGYGAGCPLLTHSGHCANPQNFPCPRHRPPGWAANRPHDDRHLRSDDVLQLLADLFSSADIGDRWRHSVCKIATSDRLQQCFWPASSDLALPSKSHEAIPRGDG